MRIVISSGHGLHIRGAHGDNTGLDEVDEARAVVEQTAADLRGLGVTVTTYHDDVSTTQDENLNRIVDYHNSQTRDLDVSVHFNAYEETDDPMGAECWYTSEGMEKLAADVSWAIALEGQMLDRGAKHSDSLFFLNATGEPAILIEVCFVDSTCDAEVYRENKDKICAAIAEVLAKSGSRSDTDGAAIS